MAQRRRTPEEEAAVEFVPEPGKPRPAVDFEKPTHLAGEEALDYREHYGQATKRSTSVRQAEYQPPPENGEGWAEGLKEEFFRQQEEIQRLEGAEARLYGQQQLVEEVNAALKLAQTKREVAESGQKKLVKKLKKLQKSCFAACIKNYQGRLQTAEENVKEGEVVLQNARDEEAAAAEACKGPKELLADAQTQVNLKAEKEKRQLAILEQLYGGWDGGDPAENVAEQNVALLSSRRRDILSAEAAQERALAHVGEALRYIEISMSLLRGALRAQTIDAFAFDNGGLVSTIAGLTAQYKISEAAKHAQLSQEEVQRAVYYSPFMPISELARIDDSLLGGFLNIAFDNVFTDFYALQRIWDGMVTTGRTYRQILGSFYWQKAFLDNIRYDLQVNTETLTQAMQVLLNERLRLIYAGNIRK